MASPASPLGLRVPLDLNRGPDGVIHSLRVISAPVINVSIELMIHQQDRGDTRWYPQGQLVGDVSGPPLRVEGVAARLVGHDAGLYDLSYTVDSASIRPTAIAHNGVFLGTRGQSRPLRGVEMWVQLKRTLPPLAAAPFMPVASPAPSPPVPMASVVSSSLFSPSVSPQLSVPMALFAPSVFPQLSVPMATLMSVAPPDPIAITPLAHPSLPPPPSTAPTVPTPSFLEWLSSPAVASSAAADRAAAASLATVQKALTAKLGPKSGPPQQWLTAALAESEAVFTCSGAVHIGDEDEKEAEADEAKAPNPEGGESDSHSSRVSGEDASTPPDLPLPLCMFGAQCYRKNPQHFAQFAHPHLQQPPVQSPVQTSPAATVIPLSPEPAHTAIAIPAEAKSEVTADTDGKDSMEGDNDDDWERVSTSSIPPASTAGAPPSPAAPVPAKKPEVDRSLRLSFAIPPAAASSADAPTQPAGDPLLPVVPTYELRLPFPATATAADVDRVMTLLLPLCSPATFGVGGEAVLDPTYRACSQVAPTAFLTSFSPPPGVLRDVLKLLCPASLLSLPSLRCELYKLNVYAKGGLFKAHRDTPRSASMLGSLVVCLPVPHQGGALLVRQAGREVAYDWSWQLDGGGGARRQQVQWAAFFGDVEHEIQEVTAGYRVTLTYNLYVDPTQQPLTPARPSLELRFTSSPFPALLRLLLRSPAFMPKGGRLGVYCQQGYAHTSEAMQATLNPSVLKGSDALLYQAVTDLGVQCDFVPVMGGGGWGSPAGVYVFPSFMSTDTSHTMAGDDDDDRDDEGEQEVLGERPVKDVDWLNGTGGVQELQEAHAAYGNEPTMGTMYSRAAIVMAVGAWVDGRRVRTRTQKQPEAAPSVLLSQHPHSLLWMMKPYGRGGWQCNLCRFGGNGGVWHCALCRWDACSRCKDRLHRPPQGIEEEDEEEEQDEEEEEEEDEDEGDH